MNGDGAELPNETAAVHGMLVVGDKDVFMSHLPMFHVPHNYQVFFQVTLSEEGGDPFRVYQEDRRISKEPIYTWVPEPFVLAQLLAPAEVRRLMTGTLYRGHFERGGTPITSDRVSATVKRVLYGRRFSANDQRPAQLSYFIFGSVAEPFIAHAVTRPPDFDQIASISTQGLPEDWDGTAMRFEVANRNDAADQRLSSGESISVNLEGLGASAAVNITVKDEFYLETTDLAS